MEIIRLKGVDMKIYVMYEVGGAMGHVTPGLDPDPELNKVITAEVNAAIAGAAEAGATEFLVNTGCPPATHVIMDQVDPRAEVIRGLWKPSQTMEGLDESFDAMIVLSMHAKAHTPRAVFSHTWSFNIYDYRVNGTSIGELGMAAYFAGAMGVPTVMVSGDTATCEEAKQLLGDVEVGPTKERVPHPSLVLEGIHNAARRAIQRIDEFKPLKLSSPVTVEIDMTNPVMIPWWLWVPTIEANGPSGVKYQAENYASAHRLFLVLQKLEMAWMEESGLS
jgi:D-amino peptidase